MTRTTSLIAAMALATSGSFAQPSPAQVMESVDSVISVTLLDGWREQNGGHYAGIQIDLAPGWKTYWRAPGDGGIPTTVTWAGSENLNSAQIYWPRPKVFRQYGMRSVGYSDRVVLPVHLEALSDGPINAQLSLRLGVCKEICLPVEVTLSHQLDAQGTAHVAPIKAAMSDRPMPVEAQLSCELHHTDHGYQLDVATLLPVLDGVAETSVIELSDPTVWVSEPEFARAGSSVTSSVRLVQQRPSDSIDLSTVRMTVLTTTTAVELTGCD